MVKDRPQRKSAVNQPHLLDLELLNVGDAEVVEEGEAAVGEPERHVSDDEGAPHVAVLVRGEPRREPAEHGLAPRVRVQHDEQAQRQVACAAERERSPVNGPWTRSSERD